jgi:hypothetical protein
LVTTQELFGDAAESKPVKKEAAPHRRPFSFLIPGVHLLGKPRTVVDEPADAPATAPISDTTDTTSLVPPEPATLKQGGAGWNIRITAETVIEPDVPASDAPGLDLDLTPQPDRVIPISLQLVAAIPRTYVPALDPAKPLPRSRRQRLLSLWFRLAALGRAPVRPALKLVSVSGAGLKTSVQSVGTKIKFRPRSLKLHLRPFHPSRRLLVIGAVLVIALVGAAGAMVVTVVNRTSFKPAVQSHHASSAASVVTTTIRPARIATPPTPAPAAAPSSAAAAPAPIAVVFAPVQHATPAPTAPPAPTPVPTPTPPVQLSDNASGYLSVNPATHACSPSTGFAAASLIGPDGLARSCTYTFTENIAGTVSAKLTSTGDPLGSSPVVQASGYCILLYGASGTTPLTKTCTPNNSAGPALFTQNTSTLSQTTGTFRLEIEAMSAKTSFTFSVTHY